MKKTAIYLRVSTEEQRERHTIATQRQAAERYLQQHHFLQVQWYEDNGVSGMIPLADRPAGKQLLHDAQEGVIDRVVVYKLDRLGRDPLVILTAVGQIQAQHIMLESMTETLDHSSPSGKFLLAILSAAAGLERDAFLERSIEGTNRLAREGAWLGGIVPYGYRVIGKQKDARLHISEESIAGFEYSEADIIRLIYHMTVVENKSCFTIATYLNTLGIPPVYSRDQRTILRGKRRCRTSGRWTPGRIRNMLVNTTYKGVHYYGRRSKKTRELIARAVPAIVDEGTWEQAQHVLSAHQLFSKRNAKRRYLLRGLIKCGHCGLTYIGTGYNVKRCPYYYVCNGRHGRQLFQTRGEKCFSKAIPGPELEALIWNDVETFLRCPGELLRQFEAQIRAEAVNYDELLREIASFEATLQEKEQEKQSVIGLFRRGRISEQDLDQQLDEIEAETQQAREQLTQLQEQFALMQTQEQSLETAEEVLFALQRRLQARLEQPLSWEIKRQMIEALVKQVRLDTLIADDGKKEVRIAVTYRFGDTMAFCKTYSPVRSLQGGLDEQEGLLMKTPEKEEVLCE